MLRLIACAALMLSAVVPVEQPATFAENWHTVEDTSLCVDLDSQKFDENEVTWTYESCGSSNSSQAKASCTYQPRMSDDIFVWYVYDASRGWIEQTAQFQTAEYKMIVDECLDWASAPASARSST